MHPARELIVRRPRNLGSLAHQGLDGQGEVEELDEVTARDAQEILEKSIRLNDQRMTRVVELLEEAGVSSVVDLGCGERGGGCSAST